MKIKSCKLTWPLPDNLKIWLFGRKPGRLSVQFLNIAKGSNGEVRSQLHVALEQKYISEKEFTKLRETTILLSRRLSAFIRYLEGYAGNSRVRKPASRQSKNL